MILSLDASLPVLSVAVIDDDRIVGVVALEGRDSRNEKLLPAVDWILSEAGVAKSDLTTLVVTRGPGSFTGVRIALATVEGLAFAIGCRVIAMSTLHAIAAAAGASKRVLVTSEAGRGELYAAIYRGLAIERAEQIVKPEALEEWRTSVDEQLAAETVMRERNVALLAAMRTKEIISAGQQDRFSDTTPLYVRLSAPEEKLLAQKLDA